MNPEKAILKCSALLVSMAWLAGCASIHPGIMATPLDESGAAMSLDTTPRGLTVSCDVDDDLSSEYFSLVSVTIENQTSDWIVIPEVNLSFESEHMASVVRIPAGGDLVQWYDSTIELKRINDHNRSVLLGSLIVAGSVVGAAGSASDSDAGKAVAAVGHLVAAGAATASIVEEVDQTLDQVENAQIYPGNHLLSGNLKVPPGLFVRKFLVLHFKDKDTWEKRYFMLNFIRSDGHAEMVALPANCSGYGPYRGKAR